MSLTGALGRYFAAWNDHDPDAVVRSLAGGGSYEDATTGGPLTGDALAANVAALLAGFPDLHSTWSAWPHQRRHGRCPVADAGTNTGQTVALPAPTSSTATPAQRIAQST
jgi:SnoaL-like domain